MAIAPKFVAHILGSIAHPVHTLEIYLDYVCPFSAKLFKRVYNDVKPIIDARFPNKVQIVFRQQVQPWHPSSTLTHEAALAVERVDPSSFWKYSAAIFENQVDFFDVNVVNETRNATYKRLSALAAPLGVDEQQIYKLLTVPDKPANGSYNLGNQITNDLKLHVKAARLVGVHVSPTVIFDGIVDNSISSGWDVAQWEEWLAKNVVV